MNKEKLIKEIAKYFCKSVFPNVESYETANEIIKDACNVHAENIVNIFLAAWLKEENNEL